MNQLQSAALTLAGAMLVFLAIGFAIWWLRRPRAAPAAPRAPRAARVPRAPGESWFPKLSRKAKPELETIEMAPSRLARISRKTPLDQLSDDNGDGHDDANEFAAAPDPVVDSAPEAIEATLEAMVAEVEQEAHRPEESPEESATEEPAIAETVAEDAGIEERSAEEVVVRLVPQIPPRDAISTSSWLGGQPRLPGGMEWPQIGGEAADFLAQIDCAGLPQDLWGRLGPRDGALAFFVHRRNPEVRVFHLRDTDTAVAAPLALDNQGGWFAPHGGIGFGDLAAFTVHAFPEWPVDLVAVAPGDTDPRSENDSGAAGDALHDRGYDIADPAFHPFDWGSMTAMVALLEMRLDRLATEAAPPAGASAEDVSEMEQRAAINREARARAEEIIAIVRDSAAKQAFSPGDATAVMAALHAIRWAKAIRSVDPETGIDQVETITLPLTTHRPDANLWVHDYQTVLFDRAKHAWCTNPGSLSAPARAFYEPQWRELAAHTMAAMGDAPSRHVHDYDPERDAVLLELPTSGLMSRRFGDGDNLVVTIDKADLAIGDFSKLRAQVSN
ncbi:DUF1963 domain-containing protein [Sphingopyxis fribergensis]